MDLEELSLTELREKAKEAGIKSATKFKKEELISILKEENVDVDKVAEEPEEEKKEFKEVITKEGYKLTSEGAEAEEQRRIDKDNSGKK